jgi:hypothetical protein
LKFRPARHALLIEGITSNPAQSEWRIKMKDVKIVAPKFKESEMADANVAIKFLLDIREHAAKKQIRATHALKMLVEAHPKMSRVVVSKSAIYAGLNRVTACHIWDEVHNG